MAIQFTKQRWPKYAQDIPLGLGPLFQDRYRLSIAEDLLVYDDRIVVPRSMRQEVENCSHCQIGRSTQRSEPLMTAPLPDRAWSHLAADLCELKGKKYLVVIEYYSRYLEIAHLTTTTSQAVILQFKDMFARWGLCDKITTDNGAQFSSDEFRQFTKDYTFQHVTSSPGFPQSNGEAERAVQIAKRSSFRTIHPWG